jgi:fructokinase
MIVVGGENLIDYVQSGHKDGLPVYTAIPGGSCYNVALAAARQGYPVSYVTPISNDTLGDLLANRLIEDGVTLAAPRDTAPTSLAVVSVVDSIPSYQFYRQGTAERNVTMGSLAQNTAEDVKIFHIGSLALIIGEDADAWETHFKNLFTKGIITALDPNARPIVVTDKPPYIARLLRMLSQTVVLKLSDEDLEYIYPDMPMMDAFDKICNLTSASIMVLTQGAKGAIARSRVAEAVVPAGVANPLVDTVGAGDTFMGTLLGQIHHNGMDANALANLDKAALNELISRAAKAAAINCQSAGCNPPFARDL